MVSSPADPFIADWMRTRSAGSSQFNSAGTEEANDGTEGVAAAAALAAKRKVSRRLNVERFGIGLSQNEGTNLDQRYSETQGT
jgi:hypothetical protein